ncbi:hypothetical protein D3875_07145 [Deinococcus cavernae]|uniref:DUF3592 domain-containing protein n=1 Tax=Deinococcus cavernae TaxID=2320857 RepID=A0A418V5P3_9DEIO|nr:DUF3592 domain-containing protein [Deinococcus cavernae]RJF71379.1 hypothetical protein D3875_07145 [Deinococcus cavernae]
MVFLLLGLFLGMLGVLLLLLGVVFVSTGFGGTVGWMTRPNRNPREWPEVSARVVGHSAYPTPYRGHRPLNPRYTSGSCLVEAPWQGQLIRAFVFPRALRNLTGYGTAEQIRKQAEQALPVGSSLQIRIDPNDLPQGSWVVAEASDCAPTHVHNAGASLGLGLLGVVSGTAGLGLLGLAFVVGRSAP